MKKSDFILILAVLAVAASAYFAFRQQSAQAMRVVVFADGELLTSESLTGGKNPIVVENSYGRNVIEIHSDGVEVVWADCASQACVRTGKISRPGEVIACLPHRLLIILEGAPNSEDVDVVAR